MMFKNIGRCGETGDRQPDRINGTGGGAPCVQRLGHRAVPLNGSARDRDAGAQGQDSRARHGATRAEPLRYFTATQTAVIHRDRLTNDVTALATPGAGALQFPRRARAATRGHHMNLSAPTLPVFLVSIILAILAVLVVYAGVKIPVVSGNTFITLLIGYVVLLAGNLFKGI